MVVNWDQPGIGKSYGAAPIESLTVDEFVSDAHELTHFMKERFHQDKICNRAVLGYFSCTSWSSNTRTISPPGDIKK